MASIQQLICGDNGSYILSQHSTKEREIKGEGVKFSKLKNESEIMDGACSASISPNHTCSCKRLWFL